MKVKGFLKKSPMNVSFLADNKNHFVKTPPISLQFDNRTFNTVCTTHVPQEYYDNYVMTTTFSDTMQRLQAFQAATLAQHCKTPKSMVEIGCGDGSFLKHCQLHFKEVIGIEPSVRFGEEARKAGFKVICAYVSGKGEGLKKKFDAFASRQVFEHLKDPLDVLLGIKKMLKKGAVGLIEVPNGYRALRSGRFYEFFPDHIQYYSVNKLVEIATKAGFNVISCNETFGGDYLELWVRWEPDAVSHLKRMSRSQASLSAAINRFITTHGSTEIFGAGAKTLSILSTLNPDVRNQILCVIDDDPHKWNKFVPNSNIPVISSAKVKEFAPKNVLIFALSYVSEIYGKVYRLLPEASVYTIKDNCIVLI